MKKLYYHYEFRPHLKMWRIELLGSEKDYLHRKYLIDRFGETSYGCFFFIVTPLEPERVVIMTTYE